MKLSQHMFDLLEYSGALAIDSARSSGLKSSNYILVWAACCAYLNQNLIEREMAEADLEEMRNG